MNLDLVKIMNIVVVTANRVFRLFKHLFELFKTFDKFFIPRFVLLRLELVLLRVLIFLENFLILYHSFGKKEIQINRLDNIRVKNLILAFHIFLCLFLCSQYDSTDHIDHTGSNYHHLQPHLYILYKGILESYEEQC